MITQKRLKELLHYNPETGSLTWKVDKARAKAGDEAGSIRYNRHPQYREVKIDGAMYMTHRLAWLYIHGDLPEDQIDHIDGNGLNNQLSNLRDVSPFENQRNRRVGKANTSGTMGVTFCSDRGTWRARINTESGRVHLGFFADIKEAIAVRKAAEVEFGYHENHGKIRQIN